MSDTALGVLITQVAAVGVILALVAVPYFVFEGAKKSVMFCIKLACVEALLLAGLYVFGSAIVTPVTLPIVLQGTIVGAVFAAIALGGWLLLRRLRGTVNG